MVVIVSGDSGNKELNSGNGWHASGSAIVNGSGTVAISGTATLTGTDQLTFRVTVGMNKPPGNPIGFMLLERSFTLDPDAPLVYGFDVPGVNSADGLLYVRFNSSSHPESGSIAVTYNLEPR